MNKNPRDTQFAGFAQLLLHEMLHKEFPSVDIKLWDGAALTDLEQIIVRRAYDLVAHALDHAFTRNIVFESPEDCASQIPDITTWPEDAQ